MSRGVVFLVGAGPGDPGLLTVRALDLLRSAEVVAYDSLVSKSILKLAVSSAEMLSVGRRRGDDKRAFVLHPEVLARARAGRRVVRLKAGDPLIFGCGAEEAEELARAGIPFEIVPGITAALGAAAYAGVPLTDRRCASSVTFTTGHGGLRVRTDGDDAPAQRKDGVGGTLVLYMGVHKLAEKLDQLVAFDRPGSTPAAYIERATEPDQRVVVGTLSNLAARVGPVTDGRKPGLVIVGEVVRLRDQIAWSEQRPLHGKRVLVARARPGTSQIAGELRDLGAKVMESPTVQVAPAADPHLLVQALERISSYGAVMFVCTTGVHRTLGLLQSRADLAAGLSAASILAIGAGVGSALRRAGITPAVDLQGACKEELARHLSSLRSARVLAISHDSGRPSLIEDLTALGVVVDIAPAYSHRYEFGPELDQAPDLVVLPSSSAAEAVLNPPLRFLITNVPLIAMGPKTEAAARRLGATTVVRAPHDTLPSVVAAVLALLGPASAPPAQQTDRAAEAMTNGREAQSTSEESGTQRGSR